MNNQQELLDLAIAAAKRAAVHIQAEVGKPREVGHKEGAATLSSQVVTEVDIESQRLILETLDDSISDGGIGLLAEESEDDGSRHECDYFWCIDPIDGTLPFIEQTPGYSVSIGLVSRAGVPEIGVIHDPVTGNVYHAVRGGGAFKNGEPLVVAEGGKLTLVMDRSLTEAENYAEVLAAVEGIAGGEVDTIAQGGAAMNACWVLDRAPAVYFKFPKPERGGGAAWDFAASACIFGEVEGAVVSDFTKGEALRLNPPGSTYMNERGVLYATSGELATAVRGMGF